MGRGFIVISAVKESTCNAGDPRDTDWIPGSGRSPGEGSGNSRQYSYLGNPTEKKLAGYSLWDRKGLDTNEQASKQAGKAGQGEHV